jgi:hypothetical protein
VALHPLLRRLLSPVGFLFVAVCFLLPFVTASCDSPDLGPASVTYSGADLVTGGHPHLAASDKVRRQYASVPPGYADQQIPPVPVQPLLVAALGLAAAGIVLCGLRRPWPRALATAGAALVTAIVLGGGEVIALHAVRTQAEKDTADVVGTERYNSPGFHLDTHPRYGFWLAVLLCLALAAFNGVALLRLSRTVPGQPEPDAQAPPVSATG